MRWIAKPLALMIGLLAVSAGFSGTSEGIELRNPVVGSSLHHDVSPPLRDIPPITPDPRVLVGPAREIPMQPIPRPVGPKVPFIDPVLQAFPVAPAMPSPILNFAGVGNVNGVLPPDTNGDVGPNHYVQMVNLSFAIWDKSGTLLYGPANNNTLWSGFGGPCETYNHGDPIVLYDQQANRWLMSQFALPGPYYQCIAISQTGDPTGAWYRYAFLVHATKMNDYPKFGVWPDGYYMSVNQFDTGGWAGAGVFAFDRAKMLSGLAATFQYFDLGAVSLNYGGLLPSDWDGPTAPPAGTPNYFVSMDDDAWGYSPDALHIWELRVDWVTPANTTFTGPVQKTTAVFDSNMCGYIRNCIPQPITSVKLDAISDRVMHRLQYRNFGSYEAMVTNHTVDVDGTNHAGIRWYELRMGVAGWTVYQQGTYAPDANHRWMGSIAMDSGGNMALGYSVSSSTVYPSIRYTGRLVGDPLGTLPQGEATLIAGGGYQTHSASRWGDYSMMAVDPSDDCTFWYTTEYYDVPSSAGWKTRIGSFKYASCGGGGGTFSISGTVSTSGGGGDARPLLPAAPLAGVTMTLTGAASATTTTDSNGNYTFTGLANGNYTVTPSLTGYVFNPTSRNVTVNNANVTGQDFTGTPGGGGTFSLSGAVTTGGGGGGDARPLLPAAPLAGVTMTLTGAASGTTTTDSNGNYTFTGLANGSYTVTPSLTGYVFNPTSQNVTVNNANVTGVNFTGTATGGGAPDLVVSALSNPPASAAAGGSFAVTDTTANQGTATAGASTTRYRLSLDSTITGADPLLTGSRAVPSLAAGANSSGTTTVTIPASLTPGTYYLGACADDLGAVAESNEGNNCRASTTTIQVTGGGGGGGDL